MAHETVKYITIYFNGLKVSLSVGISVWTFALRVEIIHILKAVIIHMIWLLQLILKYY